MFTPSWFFPAECEWPLLCPYKGSPVLSWVQYPLCGEPRETVEYFPGKPERPTACLFDIGGN